MESNSITEIFLPLALGIIMFGMGLSLVANDFKRILLYPKAVAIGLFNQIILLPVAGFLLIIFFGLKAELAVGLMILAACPGGPTSNLIANLAKGDVALSITLTAIASLITIFSIPFIINFSIGHFITEVQAVTLPLFDTIVKIFIVMVVPVSIGMAINQKFPDLAKRSESTVKVVSAVFLFIIIAGAIAKERDNVIEFFTLAGPVALALNLFTLLAGYFSARAFRLNHAQSTTISIESGIQNGTLAITIAATMLQNVQMTIPAAIYSLIMFFTATGIIFTANRAKKISRAAKAV